MSIGGRDNTTQKQNLWFAANQETLGGGGKKRRTKNVCA
jgi:hypothetical protein